MPTPQSQLLANRLARRAEAGLIDVRFVLSNRREASPERVCGEVNALYAAIEAGDCAPLDFGDSRH